MTTITIITMILSVSLAKETWFCTETTSERIGNTIQACGIGEGNDENTAREASFKAAEKEFNNLCKMDDYCRTHKITVIPKRSSCEENKEHYKCYRMISFSISNEELTTTYIPQDPETGKKNLLKKGMSKEEVAKMFGVPISTDYNSWMYYQNKLCQKSRNETCRIRFDDKNKVDFWWDVKPELTDFTH